MSNINTVEAFAKTRWRKKFRSRQQLENYQYLRLKEHHSFLKHNSVYFSDLPDIRKLNDIKHWPLMDKKIMMDNFNSLNTVNILKSDALKLAINSEKSRKFHKKLDGFSVGLSSGTSGHRGLFIVSDKEREQWAGSILAKCLPAGQIFGQRVALFLRANNNLYETINNALISFKYFDIYDSMEFNLKKLEEFDPSILVAPPSILLIIADAINSETLNLNPRKVISAAEVLLPQDEKRIKKALKQNYIHQIYQCTEGFLGCTCEYGNMHLNEDIVYVEKEYLGKDRFIPIITDFRRTSQPIVRYRLNDVLVEDRKNCPCGSVMAIIKFIDGRESDIFIFKNLKGNEVEVFSDMILRCMIYVSGLNEFRVVQTNYESLDIFLDVTSVKIKASVDYEFLRLSKRLKFTPPKITFKPYHQDLSKKLRRIERSFTPKV